eukprot:3903713-Lingulodinium_polyedra.AAC.1
MATNAVNLFGCTWLGGHVGRHSRARRLKAPAAAVAAVAPLVLLGTRSPSAVTSQWAEPQGE